jgi:FkbM family methyltransferase
MRGAGKKSMQRFYEALYHVSLAGMNYGNGADYEKSGELFVLNYIRQKLKEEKNIIIFDVGGNIGNYSSTLSAVFPGDTRIHAFEPSRKTFEKFINTTAGIGNIVPNNVGLSDVESESVLYSDNEASGLASIYQRHLPHFNISMDQREDIRLCTLDAYCEKNKIDRIHFLKLDIEGHELNALNGAKRMLNNNSIDFIQFEFGGCNIDSGTYFQNFFYLLKDKYRIYRVVRDGLVEIPFYRETNEIFTTINYLAEKR